MDWASCGYEPRKNASRGRQLEWEHVMPAFVFGKDRPCWAEGHADCDGKGRTCCAKVDEEFRHAEADLHNLAPSVGELNGDRSNHPFGRVEGEAREYGACNFEVGGSPKRAEPPPSVRGDAARIWFYMAETYGVSLTPAQRALLGRWALEDPVDEWELLRDERIEAAQGNRNPFVRP